MKVEDGRKRAQEGACRGRLSDQSTPGAKIPLLNDEH